MLGSIIALLVVVTVAAVAWKVLAIVFNVFCHVVGYLYTRYWRGPAFMKLEGLAYLVDNSDVDLADCIELVPTVAKICEEGSSVLEPKGMRKNVIKRGRKKAYATLVAQSVRNAYPNLGESRVDRDIARRKAAAIMAEHGLRASHIQQSMPIVEALIFMRTKTEMEYEDLQKCWWWSWSERGLRPSRRA